jgi:type II secretory pathway pseudopilin PulG
MMRLVRRNHVSSLSCDGGRQGFAPHRRRGLSLVEVLIAGVVLTVSAASIMTALSAGTQVSEAGSKIQQAVMLAGNLMQEIKRLPNFEDGDYAADDLGGGAHAEPYLESGETSSAVRNNFADDKTDFHGWLDGPPIAANGSAFVDAAGSPIPLFDQRAENLTNAVGLPAFVPGGRVPSMFREVLVYENDLNGATDTANGEWALEVHIIVYEGVPGNEKRELVHLAEIFRD